MTSEPSPLSDIEVRKILDDAVEALGVECHIWPTMKDLRRVREDGWQAIGGLKEIESGQSWRVWIHAEKGRRLSVGDQVESGGVRPRPFVPET